MIPYANYHKHDHVSNIFTPDTNTKQEEYIKKCVEYGHKAYYTTNHGSMGDIFEAKSLCEKYNIKCLAGLEGYIVPDPSLKDKRNYHIICIPRTNDARRKLNLASSRANIEGFYYKPRLFIDDLLAMNKNDLYITTACVAGLLRDEDSYSQIFIPLMKHFEDNIFLEVQTHDESIQKDINKKAIKLHNKFGLRLIAANDSHYIDDSGKQERLELLKGKHITYGDEDNFILDFPTAETMFDRFQKQGILSEQQIEDAITNTLLFDECEEIALDHSIKMPTIYPDLTPKERLNLLKKIVKDKFKVIAKEENITGDELKRYIQGINYEMKIIEDTNEEIHSADYFLFNTENVRLATEKYGGVLTRGGRGSCGSFYINRILGMTQLDRFKIKLPIFPDRFASTARLLENRSCPDIDYNVRDAKQFREASKELLGEHGCYPMVSYGLMQEAEAFRNVCRSKGLDFDLYNDVAKNIEQYKNTKEWKDIYEESQRYVGTIVSASVHPCAHLLSNDDIRAEYGVVRLGDFICVLITSSEADEWKVLKNDYLFVTVWTLISKTFELIGKPIIPARQLLEEIKDDQRIWDLFKNGITCTLNQVDSDNGTRQAKQYGIDSFEAGAFLAAAIRPSFDAWREDFLNHKPYTTGSKDLDKVLDMTQQRILFQENLMQYFEWLGVTPSESIGLIKKISKKKIKPEDFKSLEERIKKVWIEKTGSEDMFDETWKMIQGCMSYGFCSAHAAATSLDMCYGAYLKVHYPYEYYTVCFNEYSDDLDHIERLTKELSYFGIELRGIKFGRSKGEYRYSKEDQCIYKGLGSIKFISKDCADELYELSKSKYKNFIELRKAIDTTSVNSRQLDILIRLNFFSDFGQNKYLLDINSMYDSVYTKKQFKKSELDKYNIPEYLIRQFSKKETEKLYKDIDMDGLFEKLIENIPQKSLTIKEQISAEIEYLGYADSTFPKVSENIYIVIDYKTYKDDCKPYFSTLRCSDGEVIKTKIKNARAYRAQPFGLYSILQIDGFDWDFKKKKINDEWVNTDEQEPIVSNYEVISK